MSAVLVFGQGITQLLVRQASSSDQRDWSEDQTSQEPRLTAVSFFPGNSTRVEAARYPDEEQRNEKATASDETEPAAALRG